MKLLQYICWIIFWFGGLDIWMDGLNIHIAYYVVNLSYITCQNCGDSLKSVDFYTCVYFLVKSNQFI